MSRLRRVDSQRELERVLDDFVTKGYKIQRQGQYTAKVKEKDWGDITNHAFLALLTFIVGAITLYAAGASSAGVWVLVIVANLLYATHSWYTAEEVVIKVDESGRT